MKNLERNNQACKYCLASTSWELLPQKGLSQRGLLIRGQAFWCKKQVFWLQPEPSLAEDVSSIEPGPDCDGLISGSFCSVGDNPSGQRGCNGFEAKE